MNKKGHDHEREVRNYLIAFVSALVHKLDPTGNTVVLSGQELDEAWEKEFKFDITSDDQIRLTVS